MSEYDASMPGGIATSDVIERIGSRPKDASVDKWREYGRIVLLGLVIALAAELLANVSGVPVIIDATQALSGP